MLSPRGRFNNCMCIGRRRDIRMYHYGWLPYARSCTPRFVSDIFSLYNCQVKLTQAQDVGWRTRGIYLFLPFDGISSASYFMLARLPSYFSESSLFSLVDFGTLYKHFHPESNTISCPSYDVQADKNHDAEYVCIPLFKMVRVGACKHLLAIGSILC